MLKILVNRSLCQEYNVSELKKIAAHQFVQDFPGKLTLNLEPIAEISEDELKIVENDFKGRLPNFELKIKKVQSIPRTISGKFRYFVQHLDVEFGNYHKEMIKS